MRKIQKCLFSRSFSTSWSRSQWWSGKANAFSPLCLKHHFFVLQVAPPTTARYILLSEEETQAILNSAEECVDGECSVDDVADLIHELKDQQQMMESRLTAIMNTVAHLQHINSDKERKRDEVKAMVQDLLRVFSTDKAAFPVSGFSGDISKKTLTAYDVLSPKPYKKPSA